MKNRIESLMIKETTHNGNIIRRDLNLLTIFNVLYLVVSEKSVTHTHTHTQALQANFIYLFSRIRAREACRNHRLQRDSQVIPLQSDLCFSSNTIHINYLFIKIDSI